MTSVFISYAGLDDEDLKIDEFQKKLRYELKTLNPEDPVEVFYAGPAGDIPYATRWQTVLRDALNHADFFVVMLSRSYLHSENCARELGFFQERIALSLTPREKPPPRILPIFWRKLDSIPPVIDSINLLAVPKAAGNSSRDLRALQRKSAQDGTYEDVVQGLAEHIEEHRPRWPPGPDEFLLVPLPSTTEFDNVAPAFDRRWARDKTWFSNVIHILDSGPDVPNNQTSFRDDWDPFEIRARLDCRPFTQWDADQHLPVQIVDGVLRRSNIVPRPAHAPLTQWSAAQKSGMRDAMTVLLCEAEAVSRERIRSWLNHELGVCHTDTRVAAVPLANFPNPDDAEFPEIGRMIRLESIADAAQLRANLQEKIDEFRSRRRGPVGLSGPPGAPRNTPEE